MLQTGWSGVAGALLAAALITVPAAVVIAAPPSHADCGDPGEPPCTGPVPTDDEVAAVMTALTDPNVPSIDKTSVVTPGFSPEEAGPVDADLNRCDSHGYMPFDFVVTDIQPAPANFAGATVASPEPWPHYSIHPTPVVLVNQGGHWLITNEAAMVFMNAVWNACRYHPGFVPVH